MSEEKRPLRFVEIVSSLCQRFPVTGMMVGDGPLASQVEAAIDHAKNGGTNILHISHLQREQIAEIYAAADFLVMTSTIEGLPFVAIEALACGCPVAATDVGDLKTIIRHGETGFLVPADKPQDLAEQVAAVLGNKAMLARMRIEAREDIEASPFTREKMLSAYRELFSRTLMDVIQERPMRPDCIIS